MATTYDEHAAKQAERQADGRAIPRKRPLDLTPFAGHALGFARAGELGELIARSSVAQLLEAMRAGQLRSAELVAYYADRIARLDGHLNSVLELNPEALTVARERDEELAFKRLHGPLHGIPVLLKDNVATSDRTSTSAGAAALAGAGAAGDATLAARLRAAGAVILGKANLSEWANYMTTNSVNGFSALGGFTRNPYGAFDVGGSSSGSAVAVAAGLAPLAIGSETCGSITSPASANSVVGLKPTLGLVSRAGMIPITDELDTAGPITRNVADAALLMSVIAGRDEADRHTQAAPVVSDWLAGLRADGLRGKRIGRLLDFSRARDGDEEAAGQAVASLRAAGAEVVEIELHYEAQDFLPLLDYGLREGVKAYLRDTASGTSLRSLGDVIALNAADPEACAPFGQDILERAQACPLGEAEYRALAEQCHAHAAAAIDGALAEHGLDFLLALNNYSAGVYAIAGYPAVTLPGAYRASGEPVGATLVGTAFSDPALLAAACAFEQQHPRRREPAL